MNTKIMMRIKLRADKKFPRNGKYDNINVIGEKNKINPNAFRII